MHDSSNLTEDELSQYDREMKELWPNIVSARVLVAALNSEIHSQITPLILKLTALDSAVAKAGILFRASQQNGIKALAECHLECEKFEAEFVTKIGDILALEKVRRDKALDSLSLSRKALCRFGDKARGGEVERPNAPIDRARERRWKKSRELRFPRFGRIGC